MLWSLGLRTDASGLRVFVNVKGMNTTDIQSPDSYASPKASKVLIMGPHYGPVVGCIGILDCR